MYSRIFALVIMALPVTVLGADPARQLVASVTAGRQQTVQDLLAQGMDANAKNTAGRPVLILAAYNGNLHTLRALLGAGADANAVDKQGNTALMEAASFGHAEVVTSLLLAGADVNLKNKAGISALKRANLGKQGAVSKLLKEVGATEEGGD